MSRFLGEIRQLGYVVHDIEACCLRAEPGVLVQHPTTAPLGTRRRGDERAVGEALGVVLDERGRRVEREVDVGSGLAHTQQLADEVLLRTSHLAGQAPQQIHSHAHRQRPLSRRARGRRRP